VSGMDTRTELAIRRELTRVVDRKDRAVTEEARCMMYGAEQALAWALRDDAASPSSLVPIGRG